MLSPPMAPSPARGASSQRLLHQQTPPSSCARRRSTPRSLARSPNVRYSPYPQRACQRRRVSDSPASSDNAAAEGRVEDEQSQEDTVPRSAAEEEDRPPAVAKPGRKPGPIWRHFKKIDPGKTHGRVQCLGCRQYLGSGKPQRNMVPHVLQCDGISLLDKHFIRRVYNVPVAASTVSPSQPVAPGAVPTVPAQASAPQASANSPTASPVTQEQFDMMVARLWFECSLAFILIESPLVRKFFSVLVPHLRLPSKARLTNVLLPLVRDIVEEEVIVALKKQRVVTITTDIYTDINKCSIINFMAAGPGMPSLYWSSLNVGKVKHTAQFLAGHLERVRNEIQTKTGALVTAILTDNASNMVAAWKILESKLPVFGGGCAAHVLNLVMEEIFKTVTFVSDVQAEAYKIVKLVRSHIGLLEEFKDLQKSMIPRGHVRRALAIPVPTRWYSQHSCLKSVLLNRDVLHDLFCSPRHKQLRDSYPTVEVEVLVASEEFWAKLGYAVALLDPIIEALGVLESDEAEPSRVYEQFRRLLEGYSENPLGTRRHVHSRPPHHIFGELDPEPGNRQRNQRRSVYNIPSATRFLVRSQFKAVIKERWNYCHTDAMGIAFLLDPNTDTSLFVGEDQSNSIEEAVKFAERTEMLERLEITKEEFRGLLFDFAHAKKNWTDEYKAKNVGVKPRKWWSVHEADDDLHGTIAHLADLVFSVATSSAASERAWSIRDHIHSKRRNCLKTERVDMLTYIYINGGILHGDNIDFARFQSHPESEVVGVERNAS